jgi:hypothetical protein
MKISFYRFQHIIVVSYGSGAYIHEVNKKEFYSFQLVHMIHTDYAKSSERAAFLRLQKYSAVDLFKPETQSTVARNVWS